MLRKIPSAHPFYAVLAALLLLTGTAAAKTNIRMQAPPPGSTPYIIEVGIQTLLQRHLPVSIELTASKASTRSALDAARNQTDLYLSGPAISYFMSKGTSLYSGIKDAPKLYKNLRSILNFPLGRVHIMVHADSDITSLKGIKGKRVFLGPPGGMMTRNGIAIVEAATGYKPGRDYSLAKLDWHSGSDAFQNNQVALALAAGQVPDPLVQQISLLQNIRLLNIPKSALDKPSMKRVLATPGFTLQKIPAGAYGKHQVNTKPVTALATWVGIGTSKFMSEDLVYKITKTIFENIDELHKTASVTKVVNLENALKQMKTPLHPGALRYYREIGLKIPKNLIPPEAKK